MEEVFRFSFSFDGDDEISASLSSIVGIHRMSIVFSLAAINYLSVKNKKGIEFDTLCCILSGFTDICSHVGFHILVHEMVGAGFLSAESILDDNGDKSALISLGNEKIGEWASCEFLSAYPKFSDGIDKLSELDIEKIKRSREEVKH